MGVGLDPSRIDTARKLRCRAVAGAVVVLASLVLSAAADAAPKWSERQLPPYAVDATGAHRSVLYAVSCPSEALCVAVGALDTIATSRTPSGGTDRWQVAKPTYDAPKQDCLEEGLSVDSCSLPRGAIDAVSCPSENLCVAVGYEGSVWVSTDPTGGAGAWSVSDLRPDGRPSHLTGISCPSTSLCVAVSGGYGGGAGKVLTSTAPLYGVWQAVQLAGVPDLRAVSCSSSTQCVAVGKDGEIFVSSDPAGGASAWREIGSPTRRDLHAVSCVGTLLCAAGDGGGNVLTSASPGRVPFDLTNADGSVLVTGISCPTESRCVAVDNNSDVLTSTDPTGGPNAWTFENLVPFVAEEEDYGQFVGNALFGVSCASPSLCAAVGAESRIFVSIDPFAAPTPAGVAKKRKRPRTKLVFAEHFWKGGIARHGRLKARFRFYSRDGARGFECKPDRGRWRECRSPLRYWVPVGWHVLRVRAIGTTGLRGPIAMARFRVVRDIYH